MAGNLFFFEYLEEYGIYDEEKMEYVGIKDDAPEEIKKSYREFEQIYSKALAEGIKI